MKKWIAIMVLCAIIAGMAGVFAGRSAKENASAADASAYLRVHIRANSNSAEDQEVKYKVRDGVVEYLTPIVASCNSKDQAMQKIGEHLNGAAEAADAVLRANGFFYGARASLKREQFPTRVYDSVTLSAGVYDALILELGTGEGDNWWCVVYPPLCFGGGNCKVQYKSKIAEICRRFFEK